MRWFSRADLLPAALDALAEGSLLWVVYVTFAVSGSAGSRLGLAEFALAAGLGLALVRRSSPGRRSRAGILAVALLAGFAGWLADPSVRAAIAAGGPLAASGGSVGGTIGAGGTAGPGAAATFAGGAAGQVAAVARHVPGWLLGVAVLRGAAHREAADDDRVVGALLAAGSPALAVPWLLHVGSADLRFAVPALLGSLLFVASSLLAIGFGRLRALGIAPHESSGGRAWTWLVLGVTALTGGLAVVAALMLGAPLEALLSAVLGPLAGALAAGAALLAPLVAPVWSAAAGLVGSLPALPHPGGAAPVPAATRPELAAGSAAPGGPSPVVIAAVVLGALVVLVALVRYRHVFASPRPWKPERTPEDRHFVVPHVSLGLRLPGLRPRLGRPGGRAPADAPSAYLAVLRALERHPELRRRPSESPAGHAGRLRGLGFPGATLGLLAADFELARYGDRALSGREHRRALSRARRLVGRIRGHPPMTA